MYFQCQAVQSVTRAGTICAIIIQIHAKHQEKKAIERHVGQGNPAPVLFQRGSERRKEREREERETRGAGPTRRSSSQLHSREVTMASDKQSTIDHFSPRRRLGAGGRGRRETTEPTAFPPLSSHATI